MTALLDAPRIRAVVAAASRAPTVHNIQPARWRFGADGDVTLFRATDRALPVADPTGRDLAASLGAAWEGLVIALSEHGLSITQPEHGAGGADGAMPPGCEAVCRGTIRAAPAPAPDPDAAAAGARRSWRGTFLEPSADQRSALAHLSSDDQRLITDAVTIREVARLHDAATLRVMRQRDYFEETARWLRLSPTDPRWHRDGLTADALALAPAERLSARLALRWGAFRTLGVVGADRVFVSESAQVESAHALVAFTPRRSRSEFESGRAFYRLWLALERIGLAAVPMSAVCDDPETAAWIAAQLSLPRDRVLRNLLRVGVAPRAPARSPRLPVDELIV